MNLDALLQRVAQGLDEPVDAQAAQEAHARVIEAVMGPTTVEDQRHRQDQRDALEAEQAWYELGVELEKKGDLTGAVKWLRKAAKVQYGDATARLARLLMRLEEFSEGLYWYDLALAAGHTATDIQDVNQHEVAPMGDGVANHSCGMPDIRVHEDHLDDWCAWITLLNVSVKVNHVAEVECTTGASPKRDSSLEARWRGSFKRSMRLRPPIDFDAIAPPICDWQNGVDVWVPVSLVLPQPVDPVVDSLVTSMRLSSVQMIEYRSRADRLTKLQTLSDYRAHAVCSYRTDQLESSFVVTYDPDVLRSNLDRCLAVEVRRKYERSEDALQIRRYSEALSDRRCAYRFAHRTFAEWFARQARFGRDLDSPWLTLPSSDRACTRVGDVMVPWHQVVTVTQTASVDSALAIALRRGVRRLPVTDERGNAIGLIYIDDLARELRAQRGAASIRRVESMMRSAAYVSADKPVDELASLMQTSATHIAIVVDDNKEPLGLVTLAQLLSPPRADRNPSSEGVPYQEAPRGQAGLGIIRPGLVVASAVL